MQKSKSKIILSILSVIFIAFACFMAFSIGNKNDTIVKADTTETTVNFLGSNIFVPLGLVPIIPVTITSTGAVSYYSYLNDGCVAPDTTSIAVSGSRRLPTSSVTYSFETPDLLVNPYSFFCDFQINFDNTNNRVIFNISSPFSYKSGSNVTGLAGFSRQLYLDTNSVLIDSWSTSYGVVEPSVHGISNTLGNSGVNLGSMFAIYADSTFNTNDIISFKLGYRVGCPWISSTYQSRFCCNEITYFDSQGFEFCISFLAPNSLYGSTTLSAHYFSDRYYFFSEDGTLDNNQFYNQGFNDGYSTGNMNGYGDGYTAGKEVGNYQGYNSGYNDGVANANEYSFIGLIGAAFDVPINAFREMFDVNILGVNLRDFFLALVTLGIIVFIVRLMLGGR